MNHIKWSNYDPKDYEEYKSKLHPIFKELLPNNSVKSFVYHFKRYNYMSLNIGLKETFELEIERFKSYLIEIYKLESHY